jgi:hypothetical protein
MLVAMVIALGSANQPANQQRTTAMLKMKPEWQYLVTQSECHPYLADDKHEQIGGHPGWET